MELTSLAGQFEALGIAVVAMTYDSVATLKEAEEEHGVPFPLLHDDAVTHVDALGIRNLDYDPGHRAYGIPYPGIFLIDADGIIRHKFAEERYQDRPLFSAVIEAAESMAEPAAGPATEPMAEPAAEPMAEPADNTAAEPM